MLVNANAISQRSGPARPGHQGMSPGTNTNSTKWNIANAMSVPLHPVALLVVAPIEEHSHQDAGQREERRDKRIL